MIGFVRTCPHHRTDVSAPSYRRVRTKTPTGPHFLETEGAQFPMCEIASVRVKRPTEGNTGREKGHRRKGNRRKPRQCEKHKSPEKALRGHQLVFWCKEAPSRAIHLTFCQKRKALLQLTMDNGQLTIISLWPRPSHRTAIVHCQLSIDNGRVFIFPRNRGHPRHPDRGQYNNGRRAWGRWQHTTPWSCLPAASRRCSPPPDGWR